MPIKSIIGFTFEEAKIILADKGINIANVKLTAQPREVEREITSWCRVANVKIIDENNVELILIKPFR